MRSFSILPKAKKLFSRVSHLACNLSKKIHQELLHYAEETRRQKETARRLEKEHAQLNENMSVLKFCKALWKLNYDKIVVDTNVFVDAEWDPKTYWREELGMDLDKMDHLDEMDDLKEEYLNAIRKVEEVYKMTNQFFDAISKLKLKIYIVTSQLNELSKMRRKGDRVKFQKAASAQRKIEELQNKGFLEVLDRTTLKESYADPEIIKASRRLVKEGRTPLVITNDRDLRIRLGGEHILRKSIKELYEEVKPDDPLNIRGGHSGRKFVCADKNCDGVLFANRDRASSWEAFSLFVDHRGIFTLRSHTNGKFVCVDKKRDAVLVAQDLPSGEHEAIEFSPVPLKGDKPRIVLLSNATGKYVSVRETKGNILLANAPEAREHEILEFC